MISRTRTSKRKRKSEDYGLNDDGISASFVDPGWDNMDGFEESLREEYGHLNKDE